VRIITCVSERSGKASIAVVLTAQMPIVATTSMASMTKNRFLTDP
jgi:hypothetical protein